MRETVFEAGGMLHGSAAPALEAVLRRQRGIHQVAANVVGGTVTIGFDETMLSEAAIRTLIEECGYHCRGEMRPLHLCAPAHQAALPAPLHAGHGDAPATTPGAVSPRPAASGDMAQMAHDMGHGGGTSMEAMVTDMRTRFLVTVVLALGVFVYSPMAADMIGLRLAAPFGWSRNIIMFVLATPAVLWGGQVFFVGAYRALRQRTLDMSVLIALSVGAGYLFSVGATFLSRFAHFWR